MSEVTTRSVLTPHLKRMSEHVDFLSRAFVETGEIEYKHKYDKLTAAICEIKQMIVDSENNN